MFTGIVTEMGKVLAVEPTGTGRRVVIEAPSTVDSMVMTTGRSRVMAASRTAS